VPPLPDWLMKHGAKMRCAPAVVSDKCYKREKQAVLVASGPAGTKGITVAGGEQPGASGVPKPVFVREEAGQAPGEKMAIQSPGIRSVTKVTVSLLVQKQL
jgi:hypothetical protein